MRRLSFLLFLFAVLVLAFAARVANLRDIFVDGAIYFVDADCYSRMTRVREVLERPGTIVREHAFENAPNGTSPHTTAPMDYLIAASKWVCDGGVRLVDWKGTSVLRGQTVDFAGAIVSLLLGLAACAWVAIWAKIMEHGAGRSTALSGSAPRPWPRGSWAAAPFFFAISPIIVHGTSLGRPDHQSLLVLLLAIALGAECRLARTSSLRWMLISGAAWGLALWVSFYEPLILLVAVVLTWLVCAPRRLFSRDRLPALYIFAAICLLAWLIEGWRLRTPENDMLIFLANWNRTIGELKRLRLTEPTLYEWLGWGCIASPVLLGMAMRYYRRAFPLLAVLLILFALTCWQLRWGYFLALGYAMTLPWQLAIVRRPWIAWTVFILSLWPLFREWDQRLFPDESAQARRAQHQIESIQLRNLAEVLRQREPGQDAIFLAPWWHSPAVAYWSGLRGVAGSSHESLPGIVDSARVYLATAPEAVAETLRARKVRWLIAADPDGVISTSAKLLDTHAPKETVATLLVQQPHSVAPFLQPVFANDFFKLFAVDETQFPR